jgi:hypothetical protein
MSNHRMTAEVLAKINLSENRTAIKEALAKMMNREPSVMEWEIAASSFYMGALATALAMIESFKGLHTVRN